MPSRMQSYLEMTGCCVQGPAGKGAAVAPERHTGGASVASAERGPQSQGHTSQALRSLCTGATTPETTLTDTPFKYSHCAMFQFLTYCSD